MRTLTPSKLQHYVMDYNYDITLEQATEVLQRLDNDYGIFTSIEIEEVTSEVVSNK